MKVQDVSHRTGQRVGHVLVEVTKKHKDMAAGRGRRSRRHNQKSKRKKENVTKKGQQQGRMMQKIKSQGGGFGGKWRDMAQREGKKQRRKL